MNVYKTITHKSQKVEIIHQNRNGKQKHNRWMDKHKVVYPCKGIAFTIKREQVLIPATTWMSLKNIISERNETQKVPCSVIFSPREISRMGKSIQSESRFVVARGWWLGVIA